MKKEKKLGFIERGILKILEGDNLISKAIYNQSKDGEEKDQIIESVKDPRNKIANRLSLIRIPLAILIPVVTVVTQNPAVVLGLSFTYAISDLFDGLWAKHIAKNPNEGGALFDAVCDKIGAVILLMPVAILVNACLFINGALELIISKINTKSKKEGAKIKSLQLGRAKMFPLSFIIICSYMVLSGASLNIEFLNLVITPEQFGTLVQLGIPVTATLEAINVCQYQKKANDFRKKQQKNKSNHKTNQNVQTNKQKNFGISKTQTIEEPKIKEELENEKKNLLEIKKELIKVPITNIPEKPKIKIKTIF